MSFEGTGVRREHHDRTGTDLSAGVELPPVAEDAVGLEAVIALSRDFMGPDP